MLCPVCKNECGTELVCCNCGFDQFRTEFVSHEDADYWMQQIVVPYREKYFHQTTISSIDWAEVLYRSKDLRYFFEITVPAALKQQVPIGHTLFISCSNELTFFFIEELKRIVAPRVVLCKNTNEIHEPKTIREFTQSSLFYCHEKAGDMVARITNCPENSIFLQNASLLPTEKAPKETLSEILKNFCIDITIGKGSSANTVKLELAPFTLIGFADKQTDVPRHYLQYFENIINFDLSDLDWCALVVASTAIDLGYSITRTAAQQIASQANMNIRKAIITTRRICDYLLVKEPDAQILTEATAKTILSQFS